MVELDALTDKDKVRTL